MKSKELDALGSLRSKELRKPIDVDMLEAETLKGNSRPGGKASDLVMGYRPVCDEIENPSIVEEIIGELPREGDTQSLRRTRS